MMQRAAPCASSLLLVGLMLPGCGGMHHEPIDGDGCTVRGDPVGERRNSANPFPFRPFNSSWWPLHRF